MARVHEKTAAKDYPAEGIKKGDRYFTWKTRVTVGKSYVGRVHRSLTRPTSTTQSAFLSSLAEIQAAFPGVEDADGLRAIAEQVRELGQEEREKFDNMPEGLQQGDTGQLLEERADGCDAWADEIESAADALETKLGEIDAKFSEENVEAWAAYHDGPDDADEPEGEDPTDEDEDQERADALSEAVEEAEGACPL